MSNFSEDTVGDFGVPGVEIEPTNLSNYDPYRGINLSEFTDADNNSITVFKYYWELLYELFQNYCGGSDFPCDLESFNGSNNFTPFVTVYQCTLYFNGLYGMNQETAYQLCDGFDRWNNYGFGSASSTQANDKIEMGWGPIINTAWQYALSSAGWCRVIHPFNGQSYSSHPSACKVPPYAPSQGKRLSVTYPPSAEISPFYGPPYTFSDVEEINHPNPRIIDISAVTGQPIVLNENADYSDFYSVGENGELIGGSALGFNIAGVPVADTANKFCDEMYASGGGGQVHAISWEQGPPEPYVVGWEIDLYNQFPGNQSYWVVNDINNPEVAQPTIINLVCRRPTGEYGTNLFDVYEDYGVYPPLDYNNDNAVQLNLTPSQNSDEFYNEDKDLRPSLGLFSTLENNIGKDNFTARLADDKFEQLTKRNLITNAEGRYVDDNNYYNQALGAGAYKPQGNWNYIGMDGVGVNLTQDNKPPSDYVVQYLQDSNFTPDTIMVDNTTEELTFSDVTVLAFNDGGESTGALTLDMIQLSNNAGGSSTEEYGYLNISLQQKFMYDVDETGFSPTAQKICELHGFTRARINTPDSVQGGNHHLGLVSWNPNLFSPVDENNPGMWVAHPELNAPTIEQIVCENYTTEEVEISGKNYGYAGYYPYLVADSNSLNVGEFQWSKWVADSECYSHGRCLKFETNSSYSDNSIIDEVLESDDVAPAIGSVEPCTMRWRYSIDEYGDGDWNLYGQTGTCVGTETCVGSGFGEPSGGSSDGGIRDGTGTGLCINPSLYWIAFPNAPYCYDYDSDYETYSADPSECSYPHFFCKLYNQQSRCLGTAGVSTGEGGQLAYSLAQKYTSILELATSNEYRTNNQFQQIYPPSSNEDKDLTLTPYSSLRVSFWMKTTEGDFINNRQPFVESGITTFNPAADSNQTTHNLDSNVSTNLSSHLENGYWSMNYADYEASYNSITSDELSIKSKLGSMARFQNQSQNTWERMEYTFNINREHLQGNTIKPLWFLIQASSDDDGSGFQGTVYLDNFEVTEGYDFLPDVDVRKKKGPDDYGIGDLTKYYDPSIPQQLEAYNDTTAPLEAQFYFYPRYFYNNPKDKPTQIIHNDFRTEQFYLYNVDWGDGSPAEFLSDPFQLGENKAVYHTYESSGVFEVTGTILRLKPDLNLEPLGTANNRRFVLRININEGLDEEFEYFGSDGFNFIPYKQTTPVIGGFSKQSIYYKTIKRMLGLLSETSVQTKFKSMGDRLKTEIALNKMDASFSDSFITLNAFKEKRTESPDNLGITISNGINTFDEELGESIGDTDIQSVKYFNKPKQIWEMFGFEDTETIEEYLFNAVEDQQDEEIPNPNHYGLPSSNRYWKKIIPKDYSIFNRQIFTNNDLIDTSSEQNWLSSDYYYPVLPKYGADGKFIENNYPADKIPFPLNGPITNESQIDSSLKISLSSELIERNVFNDNSGNQTYGFTMSDFKPKFDNETLKPEKTRNIPPIKTSKTNGAF